MIGIRNMARNKNIMSKALFKKIDAQNSAQMKSPIKKTQKE